MHILMLGGSMDHPGGVEAFCERSKLALQTRGTWRIESIPTSSAYLSFRRLPYFLKGLAGLVAYRKQRPDCVWLQYVNLPDLAYLVLARMLGQRVMVTPHLGSNWRSQSNPFLRWVSASALRLAHRLALISPTQETEISLPGSVPRSHIRNFLPEEILTSELPSDTDRPADELQLIHSGRLSIGKGTFMAVDVAAKLRDRGIAFTMRITGGADQETLATLHSKIESLGLQERVLVLGRVREEDLLAYLRRADVLVHLSSIDSYPLIVLEAMACSTTAICMELAGARDMIETYGGHVVSIRNPVDETADWLSTKTLEHIRALGTSASSDVRDDYSWQRCASALNAAFHAAAGAGNPQSNRGSAPRHR
jgi:glycosyltransferase involved in cell wall biosynthesis